MNKRKWLGLSVGGAVLAVSAIGGSLWMLRPGATEAESPAAGSAAELRAQGPGDVQAGRKAVAPRPIPLPVEAFSVPLATGVSAAASPASFQAPSAEKVPSRPAEAAVSDRGGAFLPSESSGPVTPSREFAPFAPPPDDGQGAFRAQLSDHREAPSAAVSQPASAGPELLGGLLASGEVAAAAAAGAAADGPGSASTTGAASPAREAAGGQPSLLAPPAALPPQAGTGQEVATRQPTSPGGLATGDPKAEPRPAEVRAPALLAGNEAAAANTSGEALRPPVAAAPAQHAGSNMAGTMDVAGSGTSTSAVPGPPELEGSQKPSLSIEKQAPEEIQVGKAAVFRTIVRNEGRVTAHQVVVTDRVPQGTRMVDASPEHAQTPAGEVVWHLGSLEPGAEVTLTMNVMPESEGEIGSVARVTFQAQASARTLCTRPQLSVQQELPEKALVGEEVVVRIAISNPGSGAATGVVLEEDVPAGLSHPAGRELEHEVGVLRPQETRHLELVLTAAEPGKVANVLRVRGDGGLVAEHRAQLEVTAPKLSLAITGPARRYLERQVTYEIRVANPGTANARNIDLVARLPKGMKFMAADNQAQYDPKDHAVYWTLLELPPNQEGVVQLSALPIETGEQKLEVAGRGEMGLTAQQAHATLVEGVTQLQFAVSDVQDPIEVGSETTYEISLANTGTAAANNIRLVAALPPGLAAVEGKGPTPVTLQGQQLVIEPLRQLAPGDDAVYRIRVRGTKAGDQIIRVQLTTDEAPTPVTKEEGTRVYADD